MTVPDSLALLLAPLRSCFTAPTFRVFTALLVGLVGATRRRTMCGMLIGAGLSHLVHHARAHRFYPEPAGASTSSAWRWRGW